LRAGPVDLEYFQASGDVRPALGERVKPGAQDDVLVHAATGLLDDQVLDEAGARDDGGAKEFRALRVHVRTVAPAIVRRRQPQANVVVQHMRRRIDLDVQGPPQGHAYRRAVRRRGSRVTLGIHPSNSAWLMRRGPAAAACRTVR
jgi:hypothetical protein